MDANSCLYCGNKYANKYILKKHMSNSKRCIELRNKNNLENFGEFSKNGKNEENKNEDKKVCEFCLKEYSSVYTLDRHYKSCKSLSDINVYKRINEEQKIKISELELKIKQLRHDYNSIKAINLKLENNNEKLQEKLLTNTKVINNTNNYTTQNSTNNLTVKQYVSQLQPITAIDFQNTLQHYTDKYIDEGAIGYAKFLLDHPCNNKIVTTDLSRKIVAYRTDKNEFIKDPKCRELIKMAIVDHKNDILTICTKRRKILGEMKTLDDDSYMNDVYTKKINDITEFIIFLKNDLEDYVETNVPNKISSEITNRSQQYTNVKTNVMELE